jgi:methylated-DNA-[protein]-cysteine S-methyltransferase
MPTRTPPQLPPAWLRRTESPIGRLELSSSGDSVTALSIERAGVLPHDGVPERSNDVLDLAVSQLAEYFSGTRRRFDVPVTAAGTAFQTAVWAQLSALDFGEVISYGQLGFATGRATAGRAVGGAVGANPVPLLVPCHRVLAAGGRITGYSAGNGVPTKVWLLDHEGIGHRL